jgi:hypothetical protein
MDTVKVSLAAIKEKLEGNDAKFEHVKAAVENVVTKVELVQAQLNNQEVNNRLVQEDMNKSLNKITEHLERMAQQTEVRAEQKEINKKGTAGADRMDREPKVVIFGIKECRVKNSVEMFCSSNGTWTLLQPMRAWRYGCSAVVYNNQFIVMGGRAKSMERLSLNVVQDDQSITWENFPAELPVALAWHSSVVYNGRLIVIGGYDTDTNECSDRITEISLVSPYASKLLATIPRRRSDHGVVLFGDKIVIVGGLEDDDDCATMLREVLMYDITKNECQKLEPLPYPVCEMAIVKWGDDNIIIIGGADIEYEAMSKVLLYNIKTQKSHMLPDMKFMRQGCVAAVVRDTVIVMGGKDLSGNPLKSVESFRFDRFTWEELPEMNEAKWGATAVVC